MRTLYLRNVPDEVVERLERLAERDSMSVNAVAVRELSESTRRLNNAALLQDLPDLNISVAEILENLDQAAPSGDCRRRVIRHDRPASSGTGPRAREIELIQAPHLIDSEVASAIRRHVRVGDLDAEAGWNLLHTFRWLAITRHATFPMLDRVWELRDNLTATTPLRALAEAIDAGTCARSVGPVRC